MISWTSIFFCSYISFIIWQLGIWNKSESWKMKIMCGLLKRSSREKTQDQGDINTIWFCFPIELHMYQSFSLAQVHVPKSVPQIMLGSPPMVHPKNWNELRKRSMCLKEIGLHLQNMKINLNSIINMIGWDLHDRLSSTKIFTLIMSMIFIWVPKTMRKVAMASIWICP